MNSTWWSQIGACTFDASNLYKSRLIRDHAEPKCFNLVLAPVDIVVPKAMNNNNGDGQCVVEFKYRDTENKGWKRGMDWDFVQVKKVG